MDVLAGAGCALDGYVQRQLSDLDLALVPVDVDVVLAEGLPLEAIVGIRKSTGLSGQLVSSLVADRPPVGDLDERADVAVADLVHVIHANRCGCAKGRHLDRRALRVRGAIGEDDRLDRRTACRFQVKSHLVTKSETMLDVLNADRILCGGLCPNRHAVQNHTEHGDDVYPLSSEIHATVSPRSRRRASLRCTRLRKTPYRSPRPVPDRIQARAPCWSHLTAYRLRAYRPGRSAHRPP